MKYLIIFLLIFLLLISGCSKTEIVTMHHEEKECCVPINDSYTSCCIYDCYDLDCEEDMDNYYFTEYLNCCNEILKEVCKQ